MLSRSTMHVQKRLYDCRNMMLYGSHYWYMTRHPIQEFLSNPGELGAKDQTHLFIFILRVPGIYSFRTIFVNE